MWTPGWVTAWLCWGPWAPWPGQASFCLAGLHPSWGVREGMSTFVRQSKILCSNGRVSTWNISCGSRAHFCGSFFVELDNFPGYGAGGVSAPRPAGSKHRQHTPSPKRAEEKHVPPESNYIWWTPTSEMVRVTPSSQPSLTSHGLNVKMLFITVKITGWNFISFIINHWADTYYSF